MDIRTDVMWYVGFIGAPTVGLLLIGALCGREVWLSLLVRAGVSAVSWLVLRFVKRGGVVRGVSFGLCVCLLPLHHLDRSLHGAWGVLGLLASLVALGLHWTALFSLVLVCSEFVHGLTSRACVDVAEPLALTSSLAAAVLGVGSRMEPPSGAPPVAVDRQQREVVANLSHEIRTPLYGILGLTEVALGSPRGILSREDTARLHRCATSLMRILNAVLDIRRTEEGRMPLNPETAVPLEIANHVADDLVTQSSQHGVTVHVLGNATAPVLFDAGKCEQILYNLLSNAIKFTEHGGTAVINVAMRGTTLVITVSDTGRGIPTAEQGLIFDQFTQLTPVSSTSRRRARSMHGAGLGLSYVRTMVELMEGRVSVASSGVPGEGSVFTVELPVSTAPTAAAPETDGESFGSPVSAHDQSVLVVDDSEISRIVTMSHLRHFRQVSGAEDGETALQLAAAVMFDLVVMDINLPGQLDGVQTTRELRQLRGYQAVPVLALTADQSQHRVDECLAVGIRQVLVKPITRRKLLQTIQALLRP
jgi:signal transduction histidine kinase